MLDSSGRNIEYLRLSVTDLCNLRCAYCMPDEGVQRRQHGEILRVEECIAIARAAIALGITKIRITGGEPLVRRGVLDICRGIGALHGLRELCLTTNGLLLPKYAAALKEAGVSRLNVSLDALDPKKYAEIARRGSLREALDGLAAAREAGFDSIKLNTVLMGGVNDGEIPGFVELTRDYPYEVRFIELMPMGLCADWPRERFLPADAVLSACPGLERIPDGGVAERYRMPGYAGCVGLIRPLTHSFCHACNRIRVTADGMLKPCLHSPEEIPLRGLEGEALMAAMRAGISAKPKRHAMDGGKSNSKRGMYRIGG